MLGRPRDFDEDEVLEQAMTLFWRKGFQPTSLNDLLDHTGISRQSLYNTFGGKEQLFHRVLGHYLDTRIAPLLAGMEAPGADLRAIEAYFDVVARGSTEPRSIRKGCLIVNTVVEQANQDFGTAKEMKRFTGRLQKALTHALRGAEKAEQLKPHLHLHDAAKFLATAAQGMMVASKAGASRRQQRATAQLALDAIRDNDRSTRGLR